MAASIAQLADVRDLIGDPAGAGETFADVRIEARIEAYPLDDTGTAYDLYAAAADLLEMWAARVKAEFDFGRGVNRFSRSQKFDKMVALAATYRARQRVGTASLVRGDMEVGEQQGRWR